MLTRKTVVLVGAIFVLCSFLTARAETPNALDRAPSRFAKLGDIRVHYKSLGSGETALVLVHGWTADLQSWQYQVPALEGKIRMILIDLPGHGQSDKPMTDYTIDLFARSVNAVLEHAEVQGAVLAGHSMGTPVVRQFYRLFPKKTLGLVAVDGSLRPYPMKPEQIDQFVARFSGPEFKESIGKFIESMFTEQTTEEVRKFLKSTYPAAPQHVAVSAMKAMFDSAIWKEDAITVPLQAIMAKSPFWSEDYEAYVRKLAPQADYRVMDGVGHFLMLDKPDAFNAILTDFLRKQKVLKP